MQREALSSPQHTVADPYEAIELYYEKGWTDGLPVVPPTQERVQQFLDACDKNPSDVLGVVPTRGRAITAEKVAINAVMAGCRPEYMPIVVAVIEAMTDPEFNYHGSLASTGGSAQLILVNGPIAKHLDINSGVNAFSPGWRANATIGRAIRLIIINVTDGMPGVLDKGTLGHGGKYSWCFAENEDASPWEPLHVQRGFSPTDNTITVFAALAPLQISDGTSNRPESYLNYLAESLKVFSTHLGHFIIVLPPEHARIFRNAGWTKAQAREYLHAKARISSAALRKRPGQGVIAEIAGPDDELHPVVDEPEGFVFIVAGGDAGGFTALIQPWGGGRSSKGITRLIRA